MFLGVSISHYVNPGEVPTEIPEDCIGPVVFLTASQKSKEIPHFPVLTSLFAIAKDQIGAEPDCTEEAAGTVLWRHTLTGGQHGASIRPG